MASSSWLSLGEWPTARAAATALLSPPRARFARKRRRIHGGGLRTVGLAGHRGGEQPRSRRRTHSSAAQLFREEGRGGGSFVGADAADASASTSAKSPFPQREDSSLAAGCGPPQSKRCFSAATSDSGQTLSRDPSLPQKLGLTDSGRTQTSGLTEIYLNRPPLRQKGVADCSLLLLARNKGVCHKGRQDGVVARTGKTCCCTTHRWMRGDKTRRERPLAQKNLSANPTPEGGPTRHLRKRDASPAAGREPREIRPETPFAVQTPEQTTSSQPPLRQSPGLSELPWTNTESRGGERQVPQRPRLKPAHSRKRSEFLRLERALRAENAEAPLHGPPMAHDAPVSPGDSASAFPHNYREQNAGTPRSPQWRQQIQPMRLLRHACASNATKRMGRASERP